MSTRDEIDTIIAIVSAYKCGLIEYQDAMNTLRGLPMIKLSKLTVI